MDLAEIERILEAGGPELRENLDRAVRRGLTPLRIPAPLRLSQWAEQNFYLSAESSYVEARWVCYPYQRAIMDCIGHDDIQVVNWQKSARQGYTKIILAAMGYFIEHKRRKVVMYQPTDDDRDEFVDTEIDPMLRDVRCMRAVFPSGKLRSNGNTRRFKRFLTGVLHLRGATAAKNFRRLTVDVVMYDELDAAPRDVEKEGSVTKLGDKRLEGATWPKSIRGTTPQAKGQSNIEDCVQATKSVFRWNIPCPTCDELHALHPGQLHPKHWDSPVPYGMKWSPDKPETVQHHCPHCGAGMTQAQYLEVWHRGRWQTDDGLWIDETCRFVAADGQVVDTPREISFLSWTAISPQAAWPNIAAELIAAKKKAAAGDDSELKTIVNTTLGETYSREGAKSDAAVLKARAKRETYSLRLVPMKGLILTAFVDVQDNRFEVVVVAWGRDEESWVIDYRVIYGDPGRWTIWGELDLYLSTRFPHEGGQKCSIDAVGVDTGGHFTHQVYRYAMLRESRRVHATKGENIPGKPIIARQPSKIDVNSDGQVIKEGVKLWFIGTEVAKDVIYNRLRIDQPGPGFMHMSHELGEAFFDGVVAEERVEQRTSKGIVYRWVKTGRNEPLDCWVGNLFCANRMKLHQYTDAEWRRLELALCPPTADLFNEREKPEPLPAWPGAAEVLPSVQVSAAEPTPAGAPMAPPTVPVWNAPRRRKVLSRGVA